MLVLTRKLGEKIVIAGNITLTVVAIEGNKIRIGIDAPNNVRILRSELLDHQEQRPEQKKDASDKDLDTKPSEWHDVPPSELVFH